MAATIRTEYPKRGACDASILELLAEYTADYGV